MKKWTKTNNLPIGSEQQDYLGRLYPQTEENIQAGYFPCVRGVWFKGDADKFFNQHMSVVVESLVIVRAWSDNVHTFWTYEEWIHDNGYHANFHLINKGEFVQLVNSL